MITNLISLTNEEKITSLKKFHQYFRITLDRKEESDTPTNVNLKIKIEDLKTLLQIDELKFFNDNFTNIVFTPDDDLSHLFKYQYYKDVLYLELDNYYKNIIMHVLPKDYDCMDSIILLTDEDLLNDEQYRKFFVTDKSYYKPSEDNIGIDVDSTHTNFAEEANCYYNIPLANIKFSNQTFIDVQSLNNIQIDAEYKYPDDCSTRSHIIGLLDNHDRIIDQTTEQKLQETLLGLIVKNNNDVVYSDRIIKTQNDTTTAVAGKDNFKLLDPGHTADKVYDMTLKYINDNVYLEEFDSKVVSNRNLDKIKYTYREWGDLNRKPTVITLDVNSSTEYDGCVVTLVANVKDQELQTYVDGTIKYYQVINGADVYIGKNITVSPIIEQNVERQGTQGPQIKLTNMTAGTHKFKAKYMQNDYYSKSEIEVTINIKPKISTNCTTQYIVKDYIIGDTIQLNTVVNAEDGSTLGSNDGIIRYYLNDQMNPLVPSTLSTITEPYQLPTKKGLYTYKAIYEGNFKYKPCEHTFTINVIPQPNKPIAKIKLKTDKTNYYSNENIIISASVDFVDDFGAPVKVSMSNDCVINYYDNNGNKLNDDSLLISANEFVYEIKEGQGGTTFFIYAEVSNTDSYVGAKSELTSVIIGSKPKDRVGTIASLSIVKQPEDEYYYVGKKILLRGCIYKLSEETKRILIQEAADTKTASQIEADKKTMEPFLLSDKTPIKYYEYIGDSKSDISNNAAYNNVDFPINKKSIGNYTYILEYEGNKNYLPSNTQEMISIQKQPSDLIIDRQPATDIAMNETEVTLIAKSSNPITIKQSDKNIDVSTSIDSPKISYNNSTKTTTALTTDVDSSYKYILELTFVPTTEKTIFDISSKSSLIMDEISKQEIVYTTSKIDIQVKALTEPIVGGTLVLQATTKTKDGVLIKDPLNITFTQNNVSVGSSKTVDGVTQISIPITEETQSAWKYVAYNDPTNIYAKSFSDPTTYQVQTTGTSILLEPSTTTCELNKHQQIIMNVTLKDSSGTPIDGGTVTLYFRKSTGEEVIALDENGKACTGTTQQGLYSFTLLDATTVPYIWTYYARYVSESETKHVSSKSNKVQISIVDPDATNLKLEAVPQSVVVDSVKSVKSVNFIMTLTDKSGNPIPQQYVKLFIGSNQLGNDLKTNASGVASYMQSVKEGIATPQYFNYHAEFPRVTVNSSLTYGASKSDEIEVPVLKSTNTMLSVTADKERVVAGGEDVTLTYLLRDAFGTPLASKGIGIYRGDTRIDTKYTNDKGIATFVIVNRASTADTWYYSGVFSGESGKYDSTTTRKNAVLQTYVNDALIATHLTIGTNLPSVTAGKTSEILTLSAELRDSADKLLSNKSISCKGANIDTSSITTDGLVSFQTQNKTTINDINKTYPYEFKFGGDGMYAPCSNSITIGVKNPVSLHNTVLTVTGISPKQMIANKNTEVTVTVSLIDENTQELLSGQKVTLWQKPHNGDTYTHLTSYDTTVNNGIATFVIVNRATIPNTLDFKVSFEGDPALYVGSQETFSISVVAEEVQSLKTPNLLLEQPNAVTLTGQAQVVNFKASLNDNSTPINGAKIKLVGANGGDAQTTGADGSVTLPVNVLASLSLTQDTQYPYYAEFTGNAIYEGVKSSTIYLTVKPQPAVKEKVTPTITITQSATQITAGQSGQKGIVYIYAKLTYDGNPLSGKTLTISGSNSGHKSIVTGTNGIATFDIQDSTTTSSSTGSLPYTISFDGTKDSDYNSTTGNTSIDIIAPVTVPTKTGTSLSAIASPSTVYANEGGNVNITGTLLTSSGTPIKGATLVGPTVNGSPVTCVTDSNGNGTVTIPNQTTAAGTLYKNMSFAGDDNYTSCNTTVSIKSIVRPSKTKTSLSVTASPSSIYANDGSTITLTGTLTDASGQPVKNVTITGPTVNNVVTSAITNSSGVVNISIPNQTTAAGTFTRSLIFEGNETYDGSSGSASITVTVKELKKVIITTSSGNLAKTGSSYQVSIKATTADGTPLAYENIGVRFTKASGSTPIYSLTLGPDGIQTKEVTFATGTTFTTYVTITAQNEHVGGEIKGSTCTLI